MSPASDDLERRLAFLGLRGEDREALADLRPLLEKHADSFVAAFYRHLLSFEPTRGLLTDPAVKNRLLEKQRQYLLSLALPEIDEAYEEERRRIGSTHVSVGLEPRWYLGAYSLYVSLLVPVIGESFRGDPIRAERLTVALLKRLFLDAQIAMDSYIGKREQRLEFLNRELGEASRSLEEQVATGGEVLRQTAERARAAEELASIATIVAGLAHEIGTPMGVIRGHAELLESSVSDERGRWRLRTILEQIDRISAIIQTLLNMARPHEPMRSSVELAALLSDTLAFLTEKFRRLRIEVRPRLAPGVVVHADADRLQQLFLNLFLNAVDAMPHGGTLKVELERGRDGIAAIRVADDGSGIAPETIPRIFEPFFTTKAAGKGSGLGLMVAREIVRDHGGTIDVSSQVGKGTEFRIELPV
jgi:signal transduction histidine kinase